MGSRVNTTSTAIDNRLAVTDQAFGLSSSGSGNKIGLAPFSNIDGALSFNTNTDSRTFTRISDSGNTTVLDGGAIGKSFDFAAFSLSEVLASVISGQKTALAASNYQADSVGRALQKSAEAQAAAARTAAESVSATGQALQQGFAAQAAAQKAAAQTAAENADKLRLWITENGKIVGGGAVALLVGWWIWKGRK